MGVDMYNIVDMADQPQGDFLFHDKDCDLAYRAQKYTAGIRHLTGMIPLLQFLQYSNTHMPFAGNLPDTPHHSFYSRLEHVAEIAQL